MPDDKPAIALIGVGLMGLPMALRLLEQGFQVTVRDLVGGRIAPALEAGASAAASPAEAARDADLVLLCVTGAKAVDEAVFGADGVATVASPGKLLIDHSTTDTQATREMAARLEAGTGMGWVDAPMSGGPPAAKAGELTIMAGGEAAHLARAGPALAALGGRVTHMGRVGAGQVAKMINQILVLDGFCLIAEALKLAENAGIDAARIPECLAGGYADSAVLRHHYAKMLARDYEPPSGYAKVALKDLDMVHDLAQATGTPTPMTDQAASLYRKLVANGHGELDVVAVLKLYEDEAV